MDKMSVAMAYFQSSVHETGGESKKVSVRVATGNTANVPKRKCNGWGQRKVSNEASTSCSPTVLVRVDQKTNQTWPGDLNSNTENIGLGPGGAIM